MLVHGEHMYTSAQSLAPERHLPNLGPLSADLFWYRGPGHTPVRIGTSEGVGFVKAIADEHVVREMRAASGRTD